MNSSARMRAALLAVLSIGMLSGCWHKGDRALAGPGGRSDQRPDVSWVEGPWAVYSLSDNLEQRWRLRVYPLENEQLLVLVSDSGGWVEPYRAIPTIIDGALFLSFEAINESSHLLRSSLRWGYARIGRNYDGSLTLDVLKSTVVNAPNGDRMGRGFAGSLEALVTSAQADDWASFRLGAIGIASPN